METFKSLPLAEVRIILWSKMELERWIVIDMRWSTNCYFIIIIIIFTDVEMVVVWKTAAALLPITPPPWSDGDCFPSVNDEVDKASEVMCKRTLDWCSLICLSQLLPFVCSVLPATPVFVIDRIHTVIRRRFAVNMGILRLSFAYSQFYYAFANSSERRCIMMGDWNCRSGKWRTIKKRGLEFAGLENDGLEIDGVEQEQTYIIGLLHPMRHFNVYDM